MVNGQQSDFFGSNPQELRTQPTGDSSLGYGSVFANQTGPPRIYHSREGGLVFGSPCLNLVVPSHPVAERCLDGF